MSETSKINLQCAECQAIVKGKPQYDGKRFNCPKCKQVAVFARVQPGGADTPKTAAGPAQSEATSSANEPWSADPFADFDAGTAEPSAASSADPFTSPVQADPAQETSASRCPKCTAPLPEGSVLCTQCGTHLKTGLNAKTISTAGAMGRGTMTLLVGAGAAVIGGVVWAGIAAAIDMELGWIAWGLGALVGFAMVMAAREPSPTLGAQAAGLAVVGLLIGKVLIFNWVGVQAISEVPIETLLADIPMESMAYMVYCDMRDDGAFSKEYVTFMEDDSATWEELSDEQTTRFEAEEAKIQKRVEGMGPTELERIARTQMKELAREIPLSDKIQAFLSPYDALWVILAVVSAFSIAAKGVGG